MGRITDPNVKQGLWIGDLGDLVKQADLNILNLECPLTDREGKHLKSGPHLKASPGFGSLIKKAGFQAVTLANNHILDYGPEGLLDTIAALESNEVWYLGAGSRENESTKSLVICQGGHRIGLVNFTHTEFSTAKKTDIGAYGYDLHDNYQVIMSLMEKCDHTFAIVHAGVEMYPYPTPGLQKLCRLLALFGVSGVICHHSHVVSGYEVYKGVPIFYSLGNFMFDKPGKPETWRQGLMVQFHLDDTGNLQFTWQKFHYEESGLLTLQASAANDLCEITESMVEKMWDKFIEDPLGARSCLNKMRRASVVERAINYLMPQLVWHGVDLALLNLLRNEYSHEYLVSLLESHLNSNDRKTK